MPVRKLLADMDVTVRGRIFVPCVRASRLVQDRAVRSQELHPGVARIRRVERLQKERDGAIVHGSPRGGGGYRNLTHGVYPKILAKSMKSWTAQVAVLPGSGCFPGPSAA